MNDQATELYEELKYRFRFPPHSKAESIKADFAERGLGLSGGCSDQVANSYLQNVEEILNEFTERIVSRRAHFGFKGIDDARNVVVDVHSRLFTEAGLFLAKEFPTGFDIYGPAAVGRLDSQKDQVLGHLQRTLNIRWRESSDAHAAVVSKEREQKFGILLSARQAQIDFESQAAEAGKFGNSIAVLFLDIDRFKVLNQRWTETIVDKTILLPAQELLSKLVQGRGESYRHGGEEFVIIMPNLDSREAVAFAEKIREAFESQSFQVQDEIVNITLSIGVALWPVNGPNYDEVLAAANRAEAQAKQTRNTVKAA